MDADQHLPVSSASEVKAPQLPVLGRVRSTQTVRDDDLLTAAAAFGQTKVVWQLLALTQVDARKARRHRTPSISAT